MSNILDVQPLTDRILMVHFKDGYVEHHKKGQARSQEIVITDPLDLGAATRLNSYTITSPDDAIYRTGRAPVGLGRKSKGTEFAWFVDAWINNRAVNNRPDHTKEHWVYLTLPTPMQAGKNYTLSTGSLAKNTNIWKMVFNTAKLRSEAVHVNTLGYVPTAPQKFAYVYHWQGDQGGLDIAPLVGRTFYLVDTKTGQKVFTGKVVFRMPKTQRETNQPNDTPNGNFLGADVAECDFSKFTLPGNYVVAVDGVGCSWPFDINADVYRAAFVATARGLYHNRSGIALKKPYTEFERPAPHNPKLTPGFAGKLHYTNVRYTEWGSESGDPNILSAGDKGVLTEAWGWYQDAGDWDSYESHLRVAQELLLTYSMAPQKFKDGDLNIPESGNGIPDILDEAAWLPRCCYRLRKELLAKKWGTGGIGLRIAGDAFGSDEGTKPDGTKVGRGSWEDTDRLWMASGEDPWSTLRYAGVAANLARFIKTDPEGIDWVKEAKESYAWGLANARPGDEDKEDKHLRDVRAYAAASLFVLTGDKSYEAQLAKDTQWIAPDTLLWNESALYGPSVYTLANKGDAALLTRLRGAVLSTADATLLDAPTKRALRWGGNVDFPMLVGQQTTPMIQAGIVGYGITKQSDPDRARRYLAAIYTTCDYFLGTNSLNQTWITGVGPRFPTEMFHMDAWYNGKGKFHPGLIPYSPWRKMTDTPQGPWDADWPNPTQYPRTDVWPGGERWFSNRCSPLACEFTIHQTVGPSAAIYGFLLK
jgi:endoglucanase